MNLSSHILARCIRFFRHDQGAVTVDWVVLTGAIVLLGVGAAYYVTSGVPTLADTISDHVANTPVGPPA